MMTDREIRAEAKRQMAVERKRAADQIRGARRGLRDMRAMEGVMKAWFESAERLGWLGPTT